MSYNPVVQSNPGNLTELQLELFKKIIFMGCNPVVKSNPGCLTGLQPKMGCNPNLATLKQPNP